MKKIRRIKTLVERCMDEAESKGMIFVGQDDWNGDIYRLFYLESDNSFYFFNEPKDFRVVAGLQRVNEEIADPSWTNSIIDRYNEKVELEESIKKSFAYEEDGCLYTAEYFEVRRKSL